MRSVDFSAFQEKGIATMFRNHAVFSVSRDNSVQITIFKQRKDGGRDEKSQQFKIIIEQ